MKAQRQSRKGSNFGEDLNNLSVNEITKDRITTEGAHKTPRTTQMNKHRKLVALDQQHH